MIDMIEWILRKGFDERKRRDLEQTIHPASMVYLGSFFFCFQT